MEPYTGVSVLQADGAVIKTGLLIVLKQPNLFLLFPFVSTSTRPFSPPT